MRFNRLQFGQIEINGKLFTDDVVIDAGEVRLRNSKPSKKLYPKIHTPLSTAECIPWDCRSLLVGTGIYGRLPVVDAVKDEAAQRSVELVCVPTPEIVERLKKSFPPDVNVILHLTC